MRQFTAAVALALALLQNSALRAEEAMSDPINYVRYSEYFASAGQPTAEQFEALAAAGVERVIYIAFSDQERSIANEDRVVKGLGMEYLHIPVDFGAPRISEFELFASAMQLAPKARTLLHCQVNFRATAYSMLYRVLFEQVPLAEAKADMNSIWTPNKVWTEFILEVLRRNDVDPNCAGCDWTPVEL